MHYCALFQHLDMHSRRRLVAKSLWPSYAQLRWMWLLLGLEFRHEAARQAAGCLRQQQGIHLCGARPRSFVGQRRAGRVQLTARRRQNCARTHTSTHPVGVERRGPSGSEHRVAVVHSRRPRWLQFSMLLLRTCQLQESKLCAPTTCARIIKLLLQESKVTCSFRAARIAL